MSIINKHNNNNFVVIIVVVVVIIVVVVVLDFDIPKMVKTSKKGPKNGLFWKVL